MKRRDTRLDLELIRRIVPKDDENEELRNVCQVWLLSPDKSEFKEMIQLGMAEKIFNELTHRMDTQEHSYILNNELRLFGRLYEAKHERILNATSAGVNEEIKSVRQT